jgi:hypothetical protein
MTVDQHKLQELAELRERVQRLESEVAADETLGQWPPKGFYLEYYATTGFLLGIFGAMASLLVNVIGAPIAGKSPLELIRVYLTFPLGAKALQLASQQTDVYAIGDSVMLAIGCCLYLGTGMVLGVPYFIVLARLTIGKSTIYRLLVSTVLSLLVWLITFYGIIAWVQPALIGGHWIVDPAVLPVWVAAVTHLVFGWTLALAYPLGRFQPYPQPSTGP